uniref:Transmembrane protein n=1 Tax=Pithovirus LCPAC101 TaxID=2506586 RepID=A0A481Z4K0_9VIRU|nr:MAG: hypothetical protein LCPAC101_02220 [Pithovirus LCPAC101]
MVYLAASLAVTRGSEENPKDDENYEGNQEGVEKGGTILTIAVLIITAAAAAIIITSLALALTPTKEVRLARNDDEEHDQPYDDEDDKVPNPGATPVHVLVGIFTFSIA